MTKRVLLKGEFFAEWAGSLDEAAALAGVPVGDLAFHPDDVLAEVQELRRQAYRTESDPLRWRPSLTPSLPAPSRTWRHGSQLSRRSKRGIHYLNR